MNSFHKCNFFFIDLLGFPVNYLQNNDNFDFFLIFKPLSGIFLFSFLVFSFTFSSDLFEGTWVSTRSRSKIRGPRAESATSFVWGIKCAQMSTHWQWPHPCSQLDWQAPSLQDTHRLHMCLSPARWAPPWWVTWNGGSLGSVSCSLLLKLPSWPCLYCLASLLFLSCC